MTIRLSIWTMLIAVTISAAGCSMAEHNLPPAERLRAPGPGVAGPGPGIMPPMIPAFPAEAMEPKTNVQVLFGALPGMQVRWDVSGNNNFDSVPLIVPGRQNFPEGAIYRLKLTNIEGREGVELYPSVEIGPTTPRTEAYLAHNAIPVQFTPDDFDQVMAGNYVTKVIYLPDPEFQRLALADVETLVSTRLDPGIDPIVEADRRGAIMAIVRLGNKDIQAPGADGGHVMPASFNQDADGNIISGDGPGGTSHIDDGRSGFSLHPQLGGAMMPPGLPNHVAGVSAPQWGMPITGTPIGLPGPPHIPHGVPAGLQEHTIRNHTRMHLPRPTRNIKIDVRQQPGFSYPTPANRARITESNIYPSPPFHQPHWNKHERVR